MRLALMAFAVALPVLAGCAKTSPLDDGWRSPEVVGFDATIGTDDRVTATLSFYGPRDVMGRDGVYRPAYVLETRYAATDNWSMGFVDGDFRVVGVIGQYGYDEVIKSISYESAGALGWRGLGYWKAVGIDDPHFTTNAYGVATPLDVKVTGSGDRLSVHLGSEGLDSLQLAMPGTYDYVDFQLLPEKTRDGKLLSYEPTELLAAIEPWPLDWPIENGTGWPLAGMDVDPLEVGLTFAQISSMLSEQNSVYQSTLAESPCLLGFSLAPSTKVVTLEGVPVLESSKTVFTGSIALGTSRGPTEFTYEVTKDTRDGSSLKATGSHAAEGDCQDALQPATSLSRTFTLVNKMTEEPASSVRAYLNGAHPGGPDIGAYVMTLKFLGEAGPYEIDMDLNRGWISHARYGPGHEIAWVVR